MGKDYTPDAVISRVFWITTVGVVLFSGAASVFAIWA